MGTDQEPQQFVLRLDAVGPPLLNPAAIAEERCPLRKKDKTTTKLPSGIKGDMTPVERQMYDIISVLQQNFGELHDAFQAYLQIIDDNRPSQRLRRGLARITEIWDLLILKLRNSTALLILGAAGAAGLVVTALKHVIHYFGR